MSDHWEFYPCQMGDDTAFVFYDHGIRERIQSLSLPNTLRIRAAFDDGSDAGMATELDRLAKLEDNIAAMVQGTDGVYAGRITAGGARYFICFVDLGEEAAGELVSAIEAEAGFALEYLLEPDPEKKAYWEDLFPTPADWRVIQDMKVLAALEREGDDLFVARRIDHWLSFPTPEERDRAAEWAGANHFSVAGTSDPDDASDQYGLRIFHTARPELSEITATTILLQQKAEEFGGHYDGWATHVEKQRPQSEH